MAAVATLTEAKRYDTACATCANGVPVGRWKGKAACASCLMAFEATVVLNSGELTVTPARLRALVRYVLGMGPRDYPVPLWERALQRRRLQATDRLRGGMKESP